MQRELGVGCADADVTFDNQIVLARVRKIIAIADEYPACLEP